MEILTHGDFSRYQNYFSKKLFDNFVFAFGFKLPWYGINDIKNIYIVFI